MASWSVIPPRARWWCWLPRAASTPSPPERQYPRVAELPFDAAYKLMATFHQMQGDDGREVIRCFVKGAPDQLLARSTHSLDAHQQPVSIDAMRSEYTANNERLGKQGLRVMAVARRDLDPASFDPSGDLLSQVSDLTMLALVGIVDPPRPEAKASIAKARSAGIQIRMITGDHAITAAAIAGKLGIPGRAISGAEFAALSDEEALRQIDEIGVIARVTPEHKVRLVEVLKKADKIVAMTGDGVNDAPALKKADIGVAMGITGTDVAKEAAVMILTDDNFATIIRAVENGRALYDNLLKYIRFQMGSLFAFIVTFLACGALQHPGRRPIPAFAGAVDQLHDRHLPLHWAWHGQPDARSDGATTAQSGRTDLAHPALYATDYHRGDHSSVYAGRDAIRRGRCALEHRSRPYDGYDHILARQHLLCAGDQ